MGVQRSRRTWLISMCALSTVGVAGCNGDTSTDSGANFQPTIESYDDEVQEGEDVTISYRVENTGDDTDTQTIRLQVGGRTVTSEEGVTLGSDETYNGRLSYTTEEGDAPEIEIGVVTADSQVRRAVTVVGKPPVEALDMRIRDVRSPGFGLTSVTIPVLFEIHNTDEERAIPDPEIDYNAFINGVEIASDDLLIGELAPGETVTNELELLIKYENYAEALISTIREGSFTVRLAGTVSSEGAAADFEDEYQY